MTHQTHDLVTAISAETTVGTVPYCFITCIAFPILIAVFVAAYFIWPYTPGSTSVAEIFAMSNPTGWRSFIDTLFPS